MTEWDEIFHCLWIHERSFFGEGDFVYEIGHLCQWTLHVLLHRDGILSISSFLLYFLNSLHSKCSIVLHRALPLDHYSFSTCGWFSIYFIRFLQRLSGTISGKLIYVAVILTGFHSWLQLVAGKDTFSMLCFLHGWIPQQLTDRECVGEWEFRTLGMGQLHKRYKQSCVFLMEIRLRSDITGAYWGYYSLCNSREMHCSGFGWNSCSSCVFVSSGENYCVIDQQFGAGVLNAGTTDWDKNKFTKHKKICKTQLFKPY